MCISARSECDHVDDHLSELHSGSGHVTFGLGSGHLAVLVHLAVLAVLVHLAAFAAFVVLARLLCVALHPCLGVHG